MSADGQTIVVTSTRWDGGDVDAVHVSKDGGGTWSSIDPDQASYNYWVSAAVSDDGSIISLLDEDGSASISTDTGDTWSTEDPGQDYEDENTWVATDINEDGSKMIVAGQQNAYLLGTIPESESTVTMSDPEGGKTITLTTPNGTTITCHSTVKASSLTSKDGAYSYPLGLVDFCFSGASESNAISLVFVTDLKPSQVAVRKYNPTTKAYATISEATVTETSYGGNHALQVTYAIVDNGPLDTDADAGEVADPVGLAVLNASAPNTGTASSLKNTQASLITLVTGVAIASGAVLNPLRRKVTARLSRK